MLHPSLEVRRSLMTNPPTAYLLRGRPIPCRAPQAHSFFVWPLATHACTLQGYQYDMEPMQGRPLWIARMEARDAAAEEETIVLFAM